MKKSPQISPFGPGVQKYWDKRYIYFSKFDDGIQIDEQGLYSVIPEKVGANQAKNLRSQTILDGFTGVGGSAIALAKAGKKVTTVEIDESRMKMAINNAKVYGVEDSIEFIHGNIFDYIENSDAEAINFDPPWGGPSYKELGVFKLENFAPKAAGGKDGADLLKASLGKFKEVMIRVPLIFDFSELDQFGNNYEVFDDNAGHRVVSKTVIFRDKK